MKTRKKTRRAARRVFRMCLDDGAVDERRVRLVAQRLAASPRRGALPILSDLHRLVRLERSRRSALVESAAPLDAGLRAEVEATLASRYGPRLETTFVEDPTLIAGMRISIGSEVYDGTVRGRLAELEARL